MQFVFKNNLPTSRPACKPANHLASPQQHTHGDKPRGVCVGGDTTWRRSSLCCYFQSLSALFFISRGHDLLMHVFKKFMNWSGARAKDGAVPTTARLFFLLRAHIGTSEQAACRHLKGFCSKHRDIDGSKKKWVSPLTQRRMAQNKKRWHFRNTAIKSSVAKEKNSFIVLMRAWFL